MQAAGTDNRSRATVAILGDNPVICDAIAYLVEAGGYDARIVDLGLEQETPANAEVVLVTPGSKAPGTMRPRPGEPPVLELMDLPRAAESKEPLEGRGILWPCTADELQKSIRSAIGPWTSQDPGGRSVCSPQSPSPSAGS